MEPEAVPSPPAAGWSAPPVTKVVVHPLVLLSVVDHFSRVAVDARNKRVVGILLGEMLVKSQSGPAASPASNSSAKDAAAGGGGGGGRATVPSSTAASTTTIEGDKSGKASTLSPRPLVTVHVTNSYAVPFEEDESDPSIWFIDHNYHESMYSMLKKISARETVVGWYSTGPKLRQNDIQIHSLVSEYCVNPVLVIINVHHHMTSLPSSASSSSHLPLPLSSSAASGSSHDIPTQAYCSTLQASHPSTSSSSSTTAPPEDRMVFMHVVSEVDAYEAEEIGVEHLLRDVQHANVNTLASQVSDKVSSLHSLIHRLTSIKTYLDLVVAKRLPLNQEIQYHLEDVFNLLPNLNIAELLQAFSVKTNDHMLVIYIASLIRAVTAVHAVVNNKVVNKDQEKASGSSPPVATQA